MLSRQNKVIGSIGVATLVAGLLLAPPAAAVEFQTVQVLGINDFHGRIAASGVEAGAAVLAGAVKQLRVQYPETVFAAAGDLIGASTFESFVAKDKPTIDALNSAGLEVSAVGNHEFDQGFDDLVSRVMDPGDPEGGAAWQYLGANVRNKSDGSAALPETWIQDFGDVQVGFVGAVTSHLPELVAPGGISTLSIEDPVVAANREADGLKAAGADIVVLLVHEGAATTALASATDPVSDFGKIVNGVDANVDAIISGHTHLAYNHSIPVQEWIDQGRSVTTRPVVSAGQYGYNLNQLLFNVQVDSPEQVSLAGVQQNLLPLVKTPPYPADPATTAIVSAAVSNAEVLGAVQLGSIGGAFNRAKVNPVPPATAVAEDRGGESTLGNLVAEVQRWATESSTTGGAQIALMNPGGLRADMTGGLSAPVSYPALLTTRQAANVQPFANTLVNMKLTGAQLKKVLEQQWQPAGAARPFLRLGLSAGFHYTYDPAAAAGSHITQMWLGTTPIDLATTYSVTVNSFLATGGDNFLELANGTERRDTGQVDLEAMVDYMAALAAVDPLPVDYTQRSVGVSFPAGAPSEYSAGDSVAFAVSSLIFPAVTLSSGEQRDANVRVSIGGQDVGTFPVDPTVGTDLFDEYGKAAVTFVLPAGLPAGPTVLTVTGDVTGTTFTVPIVMAPPITTVVLTASATSQIYGSSNRVTLTATVSSSDGLPVTGTVEFRNGEQTLGTAQIAGGVATLVLPSGTPAGVLNVTATVAGATSNAVTVTVNAASSLTLLLSTASSYRQGAILPAILIAGVGLNNGQAPRGTVQITVDGVAGPKLPLAFGLAIYLPSRTLPKGAHTFTATFESTDTNVAGSTSQPVVIQVR